MPEEFDPYSEWLGILAHERPSDHYRLLGIGRFTSDPATIAAAADQRMALIRSYQTGPRGRFTQQLLNEIAAAKLCLINPSAKMAYDAMLEGLASATEPPPLTVPPSPPPAPPQTSELEPEAMQAAIATENEAGDIAEVWDADEPVGVTGRSVVLALAVVVIVVVGTYVTWQVVAARSRPPINDPRVADDGTPRRGADDGETTATLPRDAPVVVFQETDGSVNFTPSVAILNGAALRLETEGITDLLTGWTSDNDSAVWQCHIVKLPPNGVFRVFVTYRATTEADEGSFTIAIGGREKNCRVRGTGDFVTDEYFLAVTRSGEQTMDLRSPQLRGGVMDVKGVRLVMTKGDEEE